MKNRFLLITTLLLSLGLSVPAGMRAGDQYPPQPQPGDPGQPGQPVQPGQPGQPGQPQSAAARISVVEGQVSTMHGDGGEWLAGSVNTPVVPGDQVATAAQSRAEVQLDFANIMRLEQSTDAKVADLEQNKINVQLASGLIEYSAVNGTQADAEIDTPNMGVHPLAPGIYRIEVDSATETMLTVLQGEAEVLTNQGSTKVEAGQQIQVHGSDNPEYKVDAAPGRDDFDNWCSNRDKQIQSAQSWQHTDQYYTGANDLDQYGQWEQVPDYGWCWTPQVDAGWVPYSAGNWDYEPYWGYTWVSSEPWGWAPYHYGRWMMYGDRWAWWPGMGYAGFRPLWSPAYVSFFGFGRGFGAGFGFGFGSIGWLALGPRDIFHPWFGAGHSFGVVGFDHLRDPGFTTPGGRAYGSNLDRVMGDQRMRAAVMHSSTQDFVSGRGGRAGMVSDSMLRSSSMVHGGMPTGSFHSSMGARAGNFSGVHGMSASQHFYSRGGASVSAMGGRTAGTSYNWRSGGSTASWQGRGGQSQRWPSAVNGGAGSSRGFAGGQNNWQRYASPSPYGGGRSEYGQSGARSGWQGNSNRSQGYAGGANRGSNYGNYGGGYGNSRPSMNLNQQIMRQRAPSGGNYSAPRGNYGGGYSAPRGGNSGGGNPGGGRGYSAPSGGGHSYSAPRGGGGGGGGGHSGGGGGHGRR